MEDALLTFEPNNSATVQAAWGAAAVALAALAGMVMMLRKKATGRTRNQNMLAAMLLFFLMLMGMGTAFFSWLKIRKTGPVTIYEHSVRTPYGTAAFKDIRDAYIYTDKQPSLTNPNRSVRATRMLVIEERNGKTHVMSEEDYPIQDMLRALKQAFSDKKREE